MASLIPAVYEIVISYRPDHQMDEADIIDWKNPDDWTITDDGKILQWDDGPRQEIITRIEALSRDQHQLRSVLVAVLALDLKTDDEAAFLEAAKELRETMCACDITNELPIRCCLMEIVLRCFKAGAELES